MSDDNEMTEKKLRDLVGPLDGPKAADRLYDVMLPRIGDNVFDQQYGLTLNTVVAKAEEAADAFLVSLYGADNLNKIERDHPGLLKRFQRDVVEQAMPLVRDIAKMG